MQAENIFPLVCGSFKLCGCCL